MLRFIFPLGLAIAALLASGCARGRKATPAPATPVAIARPEPPERPADEPLSSPQTQAELPPPQPIPEGAAPAPRGPLAAEPVEQRDDETLRPRQTASQRLPAVPTELPAPEPQPEQAPEPVPQLAPILSESDRQAYNQEIDNRLERTVAILDELRNEVLNQEQQEAFNRVSQFLVQVEEQRQQDAELARKLAERAEFLALDLRRTLR